MHALELAALQTWMASGKWKRAFTTLANQRSSELLVHCCGVPEEARQRIVLDFNRGRERVWLTLEQT